MSLTQKQKGNNAYKLGDLKLAIKHYSNYVQSDHTDNDKAYSNMALCFYKLKRYWKAIQACSNALGIDQKLSKCYFRRFMSRKQLLNIYESNKAIIEQDSDSVSETQVNQLIYGIFYDFKMFKKYSDQLSDTNQIKEMKQIQQKYSSKMFLPESIHRNKLATEGLAILSDVNQIQKQCIQGMAISWMQCQQKPYRNNDDRKKQMFERISKAKRNYHNKFDNKFDNKPTNNLLLKQDKIFERYQINQCFNDLNDIQANTGMSQLQKQQEINNIRGLMKQFRSTKVQAIQINGEKQESNTQEQTELAKTELDQKKTDSQAQNINKHPQLESKQNKKCVEYNSDQKQLVQNQVKQVQLANPYQQIFIHNYQSAKKQYQDDEFKAFTQALKIAIKTNLVKSQKQKLIGFDIPQNWTLFKIHCKGQSKKQKQIVKQLMQSHNLDFAQKYNLM